MSRIRSDNTSIERKVRKYLYSRGLRYRLKYPLPGKPDIVFPGQKIAVFVNGCFWHMHGCKLSKIPRTRTDFWTSKLERNRKRDEEVDRILTKLEWKSLRIWECEIENNIEMAVNPIFEMTGKKGSVNIDYA